MLSRPGMVNSVCDGVRIFHLITEVFDMSNLNVVDLEILNSAELAKRWGVPETWVRDQVRRRSLDPIPHVRLGKYVRFEWGSESLNDWWARRRHSPNRAGLRAG